VIIKFGRKKKEKKDQVREIGRGGMYKGRNRLVVCAGCRGVTVL